MSSFFTALTTLRRYPYQSFLATLMVSVTLFVGYSFSLTLLGSEAVLRFFETTPQVIGFFTLEATPEQISTAITELKNKPYVAELKTISKEEALELYKQENSTNPLLLELVTADILPASVEIKAKQVASLNDIRQDIAKQSGIEEVVYQESVVTSLVKWTNTIRLIGIFVIGVLGILSFLVIMIVVGMKLVVKRQAVATMQVLGATDWFIVSPLIIEGMLYGVFGSLFGWAAMMATLAYLTPWFHTFLADIIPWPIPWQLLLAQLGIGTGVAVIIGAWASIVSVQRLLKHV